MKGFMFWLLLITSPALFAQEGWHDAQGHAVPDTRSRKSVNGFGGMLMVTSDTDWQQKWATPADTVPRFTTAETVARGQKIFVLSFVSGPGLDDSGRTNVTCDIDVIPPDGKNPSHHADAVCLRGKLSGDPRYTYLSPSVVEFIGDPGDPAGKWVVRVTLKDQVRHVVIPLETSFVLKDK